MEDRSEPFGFARKSFPMLNIQSCLRLGAATVFSGLLLVVGCRSASVNSSRVVTPAPGSANGPSFYRSFEKTARPYDDEDGDQYQSPQPDPPSVLPAPGYSEPSSPPPSAKKSRWNLNNAGLKFPSFSRPNDDVRQTGVKSSSTTLNKSLKSVFTAPNAEPADVEEEVVSSRFAPSVTTPKLSSTVMPIAPPSKTSSQASAGDMPLLLPPAN